MKPAHYILLSVFFLNQLCFAQSTSCKSIFATGNIIRKAHYLAMNKYEKQSFLKNVFAVGSDRNPRFLGYDNLTVSKSFKVFGTKDDSIDLKLQTAAQKAFKRYELDSRENVSQLVATVLFEGKEITLSENNAWAVLVSKKRMTARGDITLEPIAAYSIERSGATEVVVPIIYNFDGLII